MMLLSLKKIQNNGADDNHIMSYIDIVHNNCTYNDYARATFSAG